MEVALLGGGGEADRQVSVVLALARRGLLCEGGRCIGSGVTMRGGGFWEKVCTVGVHSDGCGFGLCRVLQPSSSPLWGKLRLDIKVYLSSVIQVQCQWERACCVPWGLATSGGPVLPCFPDLSGFGASQPPPASPAGGLRGGGDGSSSRAPACQQLRAVLLDLPQAVPHAAQGARAPPRVGWWGCLLLPSDTPPLLARVQAASAPIPSLLPAWLLSPSALCSWGCKASHVRWQLSDISDEKRSKTYFCCFLTCGSGYRCHVFLSYCLRRVSFMFGYSLIEF